MNEMIDLIREANEFGSLEATLDRGNGAVELEFHRPGTTVQVRLSSETAVKLAWRILRVTERLDGIE